MKQFQKQLLPGMVKHTNNPSTQEAQIGRLWIPGQPELCSRTLLQFPFKNKTKQNKKNPALSTKRIQ
jgi:hypothetical protein